METKGRILNPRRIAALGTSLAAFALIVGLGGAMARNDDGGSRTFFVDNEPVSFVARQAESASVWVRRLTVSIRPRSREVSGDRRRKPLARVRAPARAKAAVLQARLAQAQPVTMYNDRTLRAGDAIMTEAGVRVFRGGPVFPYHDSDFVALIRAEGLSRKVTRTLASLNIVPGG